MLKRYDQGFTLIELLIVISIVAILAAIAIPQFATYRARAYNAAASSDLSNIRLTEEAMYGEFKDFGSSSVSTTTTLSLLGATAGAAQTVALSPLVNAGAKVLTEDGHNVSYTAVAKHVNGDILFGTEPETQVIMRKSGTKYSMLNDIDIPSASKNSDFTNSWIYMQ